MPAIHVILDTREAPMKVYMDGIKGLHHVTLSIGDLVFDGPDEIEALTTKLTKLLLETIKP